MKKAKAARVPVLENAFELNLPALMRMAETTGESRLVLDDGDVRTVAVLTETRLAIFLGSRPWVVDIAPVKCLRGRLRPMFRCPRAHEGNFQSLYYPPANSPAGTATDYGTAAPWLPRRPTGRGWLDSSYLQNLAVPMPLICPNVGPTSGGGGISGY